MRHVEEHDVAITTKYLEEEIICHFGVPKYIFIDNGSEWMKRLMLFVRIVKLFTSSLH